MGIFGSQISSPIEAVGNVLDKLFTSDGEKLDKQIVMERLMLRSSEIQAEINKVEAQHRSLFVAGRRPFIGWVCGFALAWHFIGFDLLVWLSVNFGIDSPPQLAGTNDLISIVIALLGLGGLRSFEKAIGRSK